MAPRERREAKAEREEAARSSKSAKEKAAEEDALWAAAGEGSKSKAGKKKDDQEAQRAEAAAKKAEAKRLAEAEERELSQLGKKGGKVAPAKVTVAQLAASAAAEVAAREAAAAAAAKAARKEVTGDAYEALVLSRNTNREEDSLDATGLDNALAALDRLELEEDDAPGTPRGRGGLRLKAAWLAYEAAALPQLMEDKPGLKRQQYTAIIWSALPEPGSGSATRAPHAPTPQQSNGSAHPRTR